MLWQKNYTTCSMHAVSLSNLMDLTWYFHENFAKTKFKTKFSWDFRENENFRETKFPEFSRKSSHFCMIFAFSLKLKNAFSFQPYLWFMIYGHQPYVGIKILRGKDFCNFIGLAKICNFSFCFDNTPYECSKHYTFTVLRN
jgi:hypothetical protein